MKIDLQDADYERFEKFQPRGRRFPKEKPPAGKRRSYTSRYRRGVLRTVEEQQLADQRKPT